jgi:hypothetical protein
VNSVIDFSAVEKFEAKSAGNADASNNCVLAELANLIADAQLDVPIANVYRSPRT